VKLKSWMVYAALGTAVGAFAASRRSSHLPEQASRNMDAALASLPPDLRPLKPRLDVSTSREGLEYDRASGAIFVGAGGLEAERGVWLHELAHARLAGARPKGALALRFTDAIEEGVADYFAAALGRNAVLGSGAAARDLRAPPRIGASEWASLAFPGFDTHRMGWALASRFYEADPAGGSLLRDLVACLDGPSSLGVASDSPASVIAALLEACPVAGRARIAAVLAAWLPPELYSVEIPT
jgi:hypothetical protein